MSKLIFTLLNYYKVVMLPSDLRILLEDYIIRNEEVNKTEDLFEYESILPDENREDAMTKINNQDFLKDIVRPYVYQVSKYETFITYQNFLKVISP